MTSTAVAHGATATTGGVGFEREIAADSWDAERHERIPITTEGGDVISGYFLGLTVPRDRSHGRICLCMAAPCIGVSGRPCVDESRSGTMGVQIVELGENKTNGYPCYQNCESCAAGGRTDYGASAA